LDIPPGASLDALDAEVWRFRGKPFPGPTLCRKPFIKHYMICFQNVIAVDTTSSDANLFIGSGRDGMHKAPSGDSDQTETDFVLAQKSLSEVMRMWFGFGIKMLIFIAGLIVLIFAVVHWG
jgi:hypothetical protein